MMSKRDTDTEKWNKCWFRKLPPKWKLFWLYVVDKCDLAGVWSVDFERASFEIGEEVNSDDLPESFQQQIEMLSDHKWWIRDFVMFQCGELSEASPFHSRVLKELKKHKLQDRLGLVYRKTSHSLKVREGKVRANKLTNTARAKSEIHANQFAEFWKSYPRKIGKGAAESSWMKIKPDKSLAAEIITAVEDQKESDQWTRDNGQYIPHPATWLNQKRWEDEVERPKSHVPDLAEFKG